ncbi:MAG: HEPN domain-containing protein [Deltaproteobacteria bacterium]|nr:HEPN domain-containing protein [Deltaproteobacteria bacterium]
MEKHAEYWLAESEKDLPVAESMLEREHYTWSLFIGHLVLEKVLKAIYVNEKHNVAPRIHDLVKLAKSTSLDLTEEQLVFLSEVSDFNLEARYPDEKHQFAVKCTREFTTNYLKRIKEMHVWLKRQMKK